MNVMAGNKKVSSLERYIQIYYANIITFNAKQNHLLI